MFNTTKTSQQVRTYLEANGWEMDTLFPGPEAFYVRKTDATHLHFTMAAPSCYFHYKSPAGVVEINTWADTQRIPAGPYRIEAAGLMVFLTMAADAAESGADAS